MVSKTVQELEKHAKAANEFDAQVKTLTHDVMRSASLVEEEPQLKKSNRELQADNARYLKPVRTISSNQKFNENFRKSYEYDIEPVKFVAEHMELGSMIETWTRPYGGMSAEYWEVPVNTPVWGPRHLAAQIKRARYTRIIMTADNANDIREYSAAGTMVGTPRADCQVQRLDARPVSSASTTFFNSKDF
jgi:hypothetical protein